jgi:hypothetical protein
MALLLMRWLALRPVTTMVWAAPRVALRAVVSASARKTFSRFSVWLPLLMVMV